VAHELNNPLSVVMGRAALLSRALEGGPLAAQADQIGQAAERCARIVKNFLALARHRAPERGRVAISPLVQEAIELLAYPLRVDSVEVVVDLAPDLPALWADGHQLHQVLVNLITNAHHALRGAPAPRRLTLTASADPGQSRVAIEVADTGPGIPPEVLPRLFEPFFTTKPPGQGTGLGLSLCRGIVEDHAGSITVESGVGQGARFRIELPVTAPEAEREEPPVARRAAVRGKSILVVDDEADVAEVLAEILALDDHEVDVAPNGQVALDRILEKPYDLVFSDIRMPELDGPGLYQRLEQLRHGLVRRFVFLTGDVLGPETRAFLERTGAPSVSKPFAASEIRRVLRQMLLPGDQREPR
jgi:CheY-like chemotaxis protein